MRRIGSVGANGRLNLFALLFAAVFILAGCGARIGGPAPAPAADSGLVVDIPTIFIDVAEDGQMTIGGIPAADLGALTGQDMSSLSMDPTTVERLMGANIQHISVRNLPQGVLLFINGAAAPAIVWDEQALESLLATLDMMGTDLGTAGKLLPLAPKLGVNFALRFPVSAGKQEMPLAVSANAAQVLAQTDIQAIAATPSAVELQINFKQDGTFELGGINPLMAGMFQGAIPQQSPETIQSVQERGITSVGIRTVPGGILLSINGSPLPFLKFDTENELFGLLDLVTTMQGDESGAMDDVKGPLQQLLPLLRRLGVSLTVNFPAP
jgi:hypothetical protein